MITTTNVLTVNVLLCVHLFLPPVANRGMTEELNCCQSLNEESAHTHIHVPHVCISVYVIETCTHSLHLRNSLLSAHSVSSSSRLRATRSLPTLDSPSAERDLQQTALNALPSIAQLPKCHFKNMHDKKVKHDHHLIQKGQNIFLLLKH